MVETQRQKEVIWLHANEVCQKEVDLEMISCSGLTRIKDMKRERVVQLKSLEAMKVNEADDPNC